MNNRFLKINNVSTETSSQSLLILSVFVCLITAVLVSAYVTFSTTGISFLGFFEWLFNIFQTMRAEMADEPILPWVILLFFFAIYIGFFASLVSKYNALKRFNSGINIRYIIFSEGKLDFIFTRPEKNFSCIYQDIKKLYIDIRSKLVRTKNGSYIAFEQMTLNFTFSDGNNYKISNTTSSPMSLIYKIIDWTRGVGEFDFGFSGYGEIPDYREKINAYRTSGYKDFIGNQSATSLKWLSILFFTMGSIFLLAFIDIIKNLSQHSVSSMIFMPFTVFLAISFIIDIILIVDEFRDKQHRGYNG